MPPKHPKIYTKPPNSGYGYEHWDLALLEAWERDWQKGRVKRRQNSVHVYPPFRTFNPIRRLRENLSANGPLEYEYWVIFLLVLGVICTLRLLYEVQLDNNEQ